MVAAIHSFRSILLLLIVLTESSLLVVVCIDWHNKQLIVAAHHRFDDLRGGLSLLIRLVVLGGKDNGALVSVARAYSLRPLVKVAVVTGLGRSKVL